MHNKDQKNSEKSDQRPNSRFSYKHIENERTLESHSAGAGKQAANKDADEYHEDERRHSNYRQNDRTYNHRNNHQRSERQNNWRTSERSDQNLDRRPSPRYGDSKQKEEDSTSGDEIKNAGKQANEDGDHNEPSKESSNNRNNNRRSDVKSDQDRDRRPISRFGNNPRDVESNSKSAGDSKDAKTSMNEDGCHIDKERSLSYRDKYKQPSPIYDKERNQRYSNDRRPYYRYDNDRYRKSENIKSDETATDSRHKNHITENHLLESNEGNDSITEKPVSTTDSHSKHKNDYKGATYDSKGRSFYSSNSRRNRYSPREANWGDRKRESKPIQLGNSDMDKNQNLCSEPVKKSTAKISDHTEDIPTAQSSKIINTSDSVKESLSKEDTDDIRHFDRKTHFHDRKSQQDNNSATQHRNKFDNHVHNNSSKRLGRPYFGQQFNDDGYKPRGRGVRRSGTSHDSNGSAKSKVTSENDHNLDKKSSRDNNASSDIPILKMNQQI